MNETLPIRPAADWQTYAHEGSAGNCLTHANPDGTWAATCTCGECTIEADVAPAPGPCVTSSFDGSDDILSEGGVWDSSVSGYSLKKVAGAARAQALSTHCFSGYTGRAWPADQSSIVTRAASGSLADRVSACVRMAEYSSSTLQGYAFQAVTDVGYSLFRIEGDESLTEIGTYAIVPTLTDVFELRAVGDTLTPILNDTILTPVVDATYATGVPGLHAWTPAETDAMTSWEGCER